MRRGRASLGTVPLPLALTLARAGMPIFGREHDLQLVQLVPFLFRAIPVGYRPELLQARSRRIRLRLVHDRYYLILGQFIGVCNVVPSSARARAQGPRWASPASGVRGTRAVKTISIKEHTSLNENE